MYHLVLYRIKATAYLAAKVVPFQQLTSIHVANDKQKKAGGWSAVASLG